MVSEFIFTLQDIPDQAAIVRQYMRHTALIRTGKNVSQVIMRALSFANTEPKGPVYCYAGREAMEEYLDEKEESQKMQALTREGALQQYNGIERSALSPHGKLAVISCSATSYLRVRHLYSRRSHRKCPHASQTTTHHHLVFGPQH